MAEMAKYPLTLKDVAKRLMKMRNDLKDIQVRSQGSKFGTGRMVHERPLPFLLHFETATKILA